MYVHHLCFLHLDPTEQIAQLSHRLMQVQSENAGLKGDKERLWNEVDELTASVKELKEQDVSEAGRE